MVMIGLVSCVKSKLDTKAEAKDHYISAFFRGMRFYVENETDRWYILSAKYGLIEPEREIEPYEKTLNKMGAHERRAWAKMVLDRLKEILPPPGSTTLVILAGQRYREGLVPSLRQAGYGIEIPMEGLSQGRQLQFLKEYQSSRSSTGAKVQRKPPPQIPIDVEMADPGQLSRLPRKGTNDDKIYRFLKKNRDGYCDDCLSDILNITPRQQVNGLARFLEGKGLIYRMRAGCHKCGRHKISNFFK